MVFIEADMLNKKQRFNFANSVEMIIFAPNKDCKYLLFTNNF